MKNRKPRRNSRVKNTAPADIVVPADIVEQMKDAYDNKQRQLSPWREAVLKAAPKRKKGTSAIEAKVANLYKGYEMPPALDSVGREINLSEDGLIEVEMLNPTPSIGRPTAIKKKEQKSYPKPMEPVEFVDKASSAIRDLTSFLLQRGNNNEVLNLVHWLCDLEDIKTRLAQESRPA